MTSRLEASEKILSADRFRFVIRTAWPSCIPQRYRRGLRDSSAVPRLPSGPPQFLGSACRRLPGTDPLGFSGRPSRNWSHPLEWGGFQLRKPSIAESFSRSSFGTFPSSGIRGNGPGPLPVQFQRNASGRAGPTNSTLANLSLPGFRSSGFAVGLDSPRASSSGKRALAGHADRLRVW